MIVGLLSDSHANVRRTVKGVQALLAAHAEIIVHCGDIEGEPVLIAMAAAIHPRNVPVYAVLGNVDEWDVTLPHFPSSTGIRVARTHIVELDGGRKACVLHGHERLLLESALLDERFDYVFTGHTHLRADSGLSRPRVINPGAIHRTHEPGVAVLDTVSGRVTWLDV